MTSTNLIGKMEMNKEEKDYIIQKLLDVLTSKKMLIVEEEHLDKVENKDIIISPKYLARALRKEL